ncbi:MAG: hypothetical protein VYD75_10140 [Pseudomonadota bacterium]|nr:hypothetical protein [Pseudomonadota bacterium]
MAFYDEFKCARLKNVKSDDTADTVTLIYHSDPTKEYVYDCSNVNTFDTQFSDFLSSIVNRKKAMVVDSFIQSRIADGSLIIKS